MANSKYELASGLDINQAPERELIESIIRDAYRIWGDGGISLRAHKEYDRLNNIDGIRVIAHGGYLKYDYRNRCTHYAFGSVSGEGWAMPGEDVDEIYRDSMCFLRPKGFELVERPSAGDIAAYSSFPEHNKWDFPLRFDHFAVVQSDGTMMSKFGPGPIVSHRVEQVPADYGSHVYFLGKMTVGAME